MKKVYNDAGKEISLKNGYSEQDVKDASKQINKEPKVLTNEEAKYYEKMQQQADNCAGLEENLER